MRNKRKAPKPIRRYSDIVNQKEIILVSMLFITYAALLYLVIIIALYWR